LAFIDEQGHLGLAHYQPGAILDFSVQHRKSPNQVTIGSVAPLQHINELFSDEVHQGHGTLLSSREELMIAVRPATGVFLNGPHPTAPVSLRR